MYLRKRIVTQASYSSKPARPDGSAVEPGPPEVPTRWILLIPSIPPRPNYLRVKIGRRLQKLGAVAVKNSVYAMPRSEGAREDLEWLAHEVSSDGRGAALLEARLIRRRTRRPSAPQLHCALQRD